MAANSSVISHYTLLLRTGTDPLWVRLRELFKERDIDPGTCMLATSLSADASFSSPYEYGLLVTADCRVFKYGIGLDPFGMDSASLSEWEDITDFYADTGYEDHVTTALAMLDN